MTHNCSKCGKMEKDEPVDQLEIFVSSDGVKVAGKGKGIVDVEETLNRLIKKHKNFMILKKKNSFGMGYM